MPPCRYQILRLKCTKFNFRGSLQRSPDLLVVFKGPNSKGTEGRRGREREDEGKGGKEMGEGPGPQKYFGPESPMTFMWGRRHASSNAWCWRCHPISRD